MIPKIPRYVYTLVWVFIVLTFIVFETFAILDPNTGDTFSEHMWWLTSSPVMRLMVAGFVVWLLLHLFKVDKYFGDR